MIEITLKQRGNIYGPFEEYAKVQMGLTRNLENSPQFNNLSEVHIAALQQRMACVGNIQRLRGHVSKRRKIRIMESERSKINQEYLDAISGGGAIMRVVAETLCSDSGGVKKLLIAYERCLYDVEGVFSNPPVTEWHRKQIDAVLKEEFYIKEKK